MASIKPLYYGICLEISAPFFKFEEVDIVELLHDLIINLIAYRLDRL